MRVLPLLMICLLSSLPELSAQSSRMTGPELQALQDKLRKLHGELRAKRLRIEELVRQRVAWNFMLEIPEAEILVDTKADSGKPPSELKQALGEFAARSARLRQKLADLRRKGVLDTSTLAMPPAAPSGIAPRLSTEADRAPTTNVSPKLIQGLSLVPRKKANDGGPLRLPRPLVAQPFSEAMQAVFVTQPAAYVTKRIASLIRAELPTVALLEAEKRLASDPKDLAALFLKGKALEKLGRSKDAIETWTEVEKLDSQENAEGKTIRGDWAKAASSAAKNLSWLQRYANFEVPDPNKLKW